MLRDYMAYYVVETYDDGKPYEYAGFYPASSFHEAVDYLEEFYGDELVVVKHLELMDISLVHINPELAKQVIAENYC